jgi:hypothetical protein
MAEPTPKYHIDQEVKSPLADGRRAFIGGIIPVGEDESPEFFYWVRYDDGEEVEEAMQTIWDESDIEPVPPKTVGKPCALLLEKGKGEDKGTRLFTFDDHTQALDVARHYQKAGYEWRMMPFEHVAVGETPKDMPIVQRDLFGKQS